MRCDGWTLWQLERDPTGYTAGDLALGSATNARRLLESIAQADAGLLGEHPLFDPDSAAPEPGKEAA